MSSITSDIHAGNPQRLPINFLKKYSDIFDVLLCEDIEDNFNRIIDYTKLCEMIDLWIIRMMNDNNYCINEMAKEIDVVFCNTNLKFILEMSDEYFNEEFLQLLDKTKPVAPVNDGLTEFDKIQLEFDKIQLEFDIMILIIKEIRNGKMNNLINLIP